MSKRYIQYSLVGLLLTMNLAWQGTAVADQTLLARLSPEPPQTRLLRDTLNQALQHLNQRLIVHPNDHEASLLKSLLYFRSGHLDNALAEINALRKRAPAFQLAHLVHADMLLARHMPVSKIGEAGIVTGLDQAARETLTGLQQEAAYRLRAHLDNDWHNKIPRQILALGQSVQHAIVVDKANHRLYLFEQQSPDMPPRLVSDYYVSTGKKAGNKLNSGDLRTPEGVYFVTSWIPDDKLPDKYGVGAFPVNYPNELDRKQGKTGYGIWLHGTERAYYSRPPLDSEGCVVLSNDDLNAIKHEIKPGLTPVIITGHIDWIDETVWQQQRKELLTALAQWQQDWESLDVERYLSHYNESFWSGTHDLHSWQQRKRYLAQFKTYQKVSLQDISLFVYPSAADNHAEMVVARLHQSYESNNFNGEMYKRLYLTRADNRWQIVYEGP